ncbi:MAG: hypothetical protein II996_01090 [Oscillospiraceae bacterium]|nr:hypothetical protein [Oscillospiraceae bacterium]
MQSKIASGQRVDKPIDTLETVQKGVRLSEWNPKVYVYTPRRDIRAK